MDGRGAAVRRLDAQIIAQEIARNEVVQIPRGAAVVEARLKGAMAAPVQGYGAAWINDAALGLQVDDAGRPQSVLGRQSSGDQRQRRDELRVQGLAEDADAFGQDDAVQPV